ncbi:ImmA/IrrE family metallo-endopeptidase [Pseudoduganella sp. R-34]|uniref:ImmA/IrrE family metallo-endopeptidase n=1 Tax=Pseudoduganella sp. R-34 TaxID=3404062 RepID=UPI003CEFA4D9
MNSTKKGDTLEHAIERVFNNMLKAGDFWCNPKLCSVHRKKGYYSKDREKDIVFDVSIECHLPGAERYSMVTLIECKNYSHSVPVDDVEEFYAKAQQVAAANVKLVLASNSAFQEGVVKFAKSKGIGLLRYFGDANTKWELYRTPSAGPTWGKDALDDAMRGIVSVEVGESDVDFCMLSPKSATHSFWEFFEDLYLSAPDGAGAYIVFRNPKGKPSCIVPFIALEELEVTCDKVLKSIGYQEGKVSLEDICLREAKEHGLVVSHHTSPPVRGSRKPVLGQISFAPLEIQLFGGPANEGRSRFTLAHELAHHLLAHGDFMAGEFCDEDDFSIARRRGSLAPDVARLEVQANMFAACLLMPERHFRADFNRLINWLALPNRGFGALFLDDQLCNYQSFHRITSELMERYGVSREAAAIRLEGLGLLRDVRSKSKCDFGLKSNDMVAD